MLFGSDSEHRGGGLRAIRDIVEIVAIIAAGIWAFYIFIYENRLVPAQAAPEAQFSATLEKVSQHDGLVGIRLVTKVHNIGTVNDNFLAFAVGATGQQIRAAKKAHSPAFRANKMSLRTEYEPSTSTAVFDDGFITTQGGSATVHDMVLEPGSEQTNEYIFYVRSGRYDVVHAYVIARFTKGTRVDKTTFTTDAEGLPAFANDVAVGVQQYKANVASLDLNGK